MRYQILCFFCNITEGIPSKEIITFALGLISGMAVNIWFAKWRFRRSGIEDFANAVKEELKTMSEVPDNLDKRLFESHGSSIRRLKAQVTIFKTAHPNKWRQIEETYNRYTFNGAVREDWRYMGSTVHADGAINGLDELLEILSELLKKVRRL